jgi:hypothetical protein
MTLKQKGLNLLFCNFKVSFFLNCQSIKEKQHEGIKTIIQLDERQKLRI